LKQIVNMDYLPSAAPRKELFGIFSLKGEIETG
jgi:hypothetical protein